MKMTISLSIECANEDEARKVMDAVEAIGAAVDKPAKGKGKPAKTPPADEEQNDDFLGSDFAGEGTEIGDGETADDEMGDFGAETETEETSDDDDDFGAAAAPAKKPAAKAAPAKAAKLTIKDVNATLKEFAAKHPKKRAGTVALLKKHFKVESTTELDPKQYAAVIKAFTVKK